MGRGRARGRRAPARRARRAHRAGRTRGSAGARSRPRRWARRSPGTACCRRCAGSCRAGTSRTRSGGSRFLAFYLLGGLVALAAQVLVDPSSTAPTLGASGAIAAVLGGYILLYPRARVLTLVFIVFFVTIVEVPAVLLLGFWFVEQLYFGAAGLASPLGGGETVAYFAHIGGFVFGLLAIRLFALHRPANRRRRGSCMSRDPIVLAAGAAVHLRLRLPDDPAFDEQGVDARWAALRLRPRAARRRDSRGASQPSTE